MKRILSVLNPSARSWATESVEAVEAVTGDFMVDNVRANFVRANPFYGQLC